MDEPQPPALTVADIAAAERLAGVRYTDGERALMLDNILAQTATAIRRRRHRLPADLGPATRFDPRPPGFVMPVEDRCRWQPADLPLPDTDAAIAFAPLTALAGWIKSGALSAARLTAIYLERIERLDGRLACFAAVTAERAMARAAELDGLLARGRWLGPLHGIPYGMKDIIDTAGVETAWGAEPYRGRVPDEDAHVAAVLDAAGAVLVGKTSVGALAYGDVWYGGTTRNPWNVAEGSSGSSAGSAAATAAGLVGFALGTETLGSIVAPSARCGTAGLRPTYGRVSRRGAMPLCWSLDKIGSICRAVEDTALVLAALNTPDPRDPFQLPGAFGYDANRSLEGMRLGYVQADLDDAGAQALDREALATAERLGLALFPLARPDLPYDTLMNVLMAEAAASFEELTLDGRDDELARQDAGAWPNAFRKARFLSAVDHVQLDRLRRRVMGVMDELLRDVDAIIGPALLRPMLVITNFTGHPCLCLRAGFERSPTRGQLSLARNALDEGPTAPGPAFEVPYNVCLWGRLYDEGTLVAIGRALEAAFGIADRRPDLG